ncbi:MAG: 16S rRNA (cytidine(1402)-2'-O)-methyltransferase [candidate division Zixibacteria bacterium]|nr:16S rRNA (cytidine(1402)-2'-O)-methyltransferase [candidate division Zixibacteria bacterium]
MANQKGTLFLVPTPIGNMGDISRRAIEILSDVNTIACEDTRHSGTLMKKLGLKKKLISYHEFNESSRALQLIDVLLEGNSIAVITDAGSPGVSDPAYRVVRAAIDSGIEVVPLPGSSAIIPALTASGLPTDRFFFEGFLPNKSGARRTRLKKLQDIPYTLIFFESPHRVIKCLTDIKTVFGNRQACLAREITKLHEQFLRGSINDILKTISEHSIKGEIVLVIAGDAYKISREKLS